MKLLIDFDGVCHDINHPILGRKMGQPIPGTKEALDSFRSKGYNVVIFTVRANTHQSTKVVKDFMDYYKLPYNSITNIKENCDWILDDKAITFKSWSEIKL